MLGASQQREHANNCQHAIRHVWQGRLQKGGLACIRGVILSWTMCFATCGRKIACHARAQTLQN
eukprot:9045893-Alexandrium_andersonii.AAC.1